LERIISKLTRRDHTRILNYLRHRLGQPKSKSLTIIFDLTRWCNLECIGCAVDAKFCISKEVTDSTELNAIEIETILKKIKEFRDQNGYKIFVDFGGGEPTLRKDFTDIIEFANRILGKNNIGFDTNGMVYGYNELSDFSNKVSYIGLSVDGLEKYHNEWRNPNGRAIAGNIYRRNMETLRKASRDPDLKEVVEVTSVLTKTNLSDVYELMKRLASMGIKKYSIHRTMPVGRMARHSELLPTAQDYLTILRYAARAWELYGLDIHLHHSLESMYGSLFLGADTFDELRLLCPAARSSIGIDPFGNAYFCPWCVAEPYSQLSAGSLQSQTSFSTIIETSEIMNFARNYCKQWVRCLRCEVDCSGGCRVAASADFISKLPKGQDPTFFDLIVGFANKDPACPLLLTNLPY